MYSHLSRAVAQEQTVDKLEFAAADHIAAQLLRSAAADGDGPASVAVPAGRRRPRYGPTRVRTSHESGCVGA